MPKFEDFLSQFKYDADVFNPDEFHGAVKAAHDEDVALWQAKVQQSDAAIAAKDAEINALKVQTWDLLMKTGKPIDPNNASGGQIPSPTDGDPNEYTPKGVDSLFGKD